MRRAASPSRHANRAPDAGARLREARVLVVDDHPAARTGICEILNTEGFPTLDCASAREALSILRRGPREPIAVALLDLHLPDLDGIRLLERLRRDHANVAVVIYTGEGSSESARQALSLGACAYLEKGGNPGQLVAAVRRACTPAVTPSATKPTEWRRPKTHATLNRIADAIPGAVYRYLLRPSGEQRFLYVSRGVEELLGLTAEEAQRDFARVWSLGHPDDVDSLRQSIQESARTLKPWSHEFRVNVGGRMKWLRGSSIPEPASDGTDIFMMRGRETGDTSMSSAHDRNHLSRILVVEDHPPELRVIVDLLAGEGFDVLGCGTAAEALDHLQQEDVGVAVVDLCLPDLGGIQLLDLLRAKCQAIRVIIYTGYGSYESAKEALNLGAFAYLEKIGDPGELLRHVHRAVLSNMDAYAVELERVVGERNRAEKALTRAREELELRVRERTAELDVVNAALREREQQLLQALEDRDTICQDLHDGALQSLYSVGLGLETCKSFLGEDPGQAREHLGHAITQLNGVMREVRYFIAGVRSDALIAGDLHTSVEKLVERLARSSSMRYRVRIEPEAATRLHLAERMQLVYIVQEAISNSLRHAHARTGLVRLAGGRHAVQLTIRDDGIGFDRRLVNGHGHGLRNIASRVRKVGGELQVHSEPGEGTQITVSFCGER